MCGVCGVAICDDLHVRCGAMIVWGWFAWSILWAGHVYCDPCGRGAPFGPASGWGPCKRLQGAGVSASAGVPAGAQMAADAGRRLGACRRLQPSGHQQGRGRLRALDQFASPPAPANAQAPAGARRLPASAGTLCLQAPPNRALNACTVKPAAPPPPGYWAPIGAPVRATVALRLSPCGRSGPRLGVPASTEGACKECRRRAPAGA